MFGLPIAQSTHTSNNVAPHMVKKVQKNFNNYASVECGAKILGANPEAKVMLYDILLKNLLTLLDLDVDKNDKYKRILICEFVPYRALQPY